MALALAPSLARAVGSWCPSGASRIGHVAARGVPMSAKSLFGPTASPLRSMHLLPGGSPRLRLRGLPFTATVDEVYAFMSGYRLATEAFVYFEDATEAIRAKDDLHLRPWCVTGTRVYRVEVLEDFVGRALVVEDDEPGDVTVEKLSDRVRKRMVGNRYKERYAGDGDGRAAISGQGPALERFKALADEWDEDTALACSLPDAPASAAR